MKYRPFDSHECAAAYKLVSEVGGYKPFLLIATHRLKIDCG